MPKGTTKHPAVGARVEIPAYCDLWMRGARFGEVVRYVDNSAKRFLDPRDPRGQDWYAVRLDHPQVRRLAYVVAADCRMISGGARHA